MNEELKKGDTVQVLKSGKLYRLKGIDSDGSYFQQWRPDRMSYYGPSFIFLKPGRYKKIEVSWPEPQRIPLPPGAKPSPKPSSRPSRRLPISKPRSRRSKSGCSSSWMTWTFMEYLKSYPWPDMDQAAPPPWSTLPTTTCGNLDRRIRYYRERNDNRGYLSLLQELSPHVETRTAQVDLERAVTKHEWTLIGLAPPRCWA